MLLRDILRDKGAAVLSIEPAATLDEVVQKLVRHNCGALIVCESPGAENCPKMVGIITERDILRACAAHKAAFGQLRVSEIMTKEVITAAPGDRVGDVMGRMTVNRIRHLSVMEDGQLVGMISIGDIVKAQHAQFAIENHYLKTYIETSGQAEAPAQ